MRIINTSEKVIGIGNGVTVLPGESIPAPNGFSVNESIAMMVGLGLIKIEETGKTEPRKIEEKAEPADDGEKVQRKSRRIISAEE